MLPTAFKGYINVSKLNHNLSYTMTKNTTYMHEQYSILYTKGIRMYGNHVRTSGSNVLYARDVPDTVLPDTGCYPVSSVK